MMGKGFGAVLVVSLLFGISTEAKCPTVEKQVKITVGMTKDEVAALLGTPGRVSGSGNMTFWWYRCSEDLYTIDFVKCSRGWCVERFGF